VAATTVAVQLLLLLFLELESCRSNAWSHLGMMLHQSRPRGYRRCHVQLVAMASMPEQEYQSFGRFGALPVFELPGGGWGWTFLLFSQPPLTHCQIMYRRVSYILYTYNLHHNFVRSPTFEKFNHQLIFHNLNTGLFYAQNAIAAGTLSRTPLKELTALSRPPSYSVKRGFAASFHEPHYFWRHSASTFGPEGPTSVSLRQFAFG